ncbi:hypothetical protein ACFP1Z_05355 [Streptomyces gamaensis]|uniref:Uncharacterized protein n=1 Tax=Streptomyces gamaensis TaxID=1763542 RepID=A0ABW0YYX1_9ACTN
MTGHNLTDPAVAYDGAPSTIREIGWVAGSTKRPTREFWLRKAALLDRIALKEATMPDGGYVLDNAVKCAEAAARQLVDFDTEQGPVSRRGAELVTGDDYRDYVRRAYLAWSHGRHS